MDKILKLANINPHLTSLQKSFDRRISLAHKSKQESVHLDTFSVVEDQDKTTYSVYSLSPITFVRQVVALCIYPELFGSDSFPDDAKKRADTFLSCLPGKSVGSYGENPGIQITRSHVADYISKRDGHFCDVNNIVTFMGSSEGILCFIELFASGKPENLQAGVLAPIPLDPTYKDVMTKYNINTISYHLDEENCWSTDEKELKRAVNEARETCIPKTILVVNPNSTTGQILSRSAIENIIKFAHGENLLILADESFQCNVYSKDYPFLSFKKVLMEMDECYNNQALVSLNSISNGYIRENGFRGGYSEVLNVDDDIWNYIYELLRAQHVPVTGQLVLDIMAYPPVPGEPSYEQYRKETENVLLNLTSKAAIASSLLRATKGIECQTVKAALTAFPKLLLPKNALLAASKLDLDPEVFYCCELANSSGVIAKPGRLYGMDDEDHHICLTFDVDDAEKEFLKFKEFHEDFIQRYS